MKNTVKIYVLTLIMVLFFSPPTFAQCEPITTAQNQMNLLNTETNDLINDWLDQIRNFIYDDLKVTATEEVIERFDEFHDNVLLALNEWAEALLLEMKEMTKQLSLVRIDQSKELGHQMDARVQNETVVMGQRKEVEAIRDMAPADTTCEVDSTAIGLSKGHKMARGIARGLANDAALDSTNSAGTPSEFGLGAQLKQMWDDYVALYCWPESGDQGCTTAGTYPGFNNDLPGLLFGDKLTIDMSDPDQQKIARDAQKYLIQPFSPDVIDGSVVDTTAGIQATLQRRAKLARINTVFNLTGQMIGERTGGTGVDTQNMRTVAGTQAADAAVDASYREIMQAVSRERFSNPEYIFRMVNFPAAVVREKNAINAIRLQQMSDLYKRLEEMLWTEAAILAAKLDRRMPDSAVETKPLRP